MMNIKEHVDVKEGKLSGIALLLASLPKPLVYWTLTLITIIGGYLTVELWAYRVFILIGVSVIAVGKIVYNQVLSIFGDMHKVQRTGYETKIAREAANKAAISTQDAIEKLGVRRQYTTVIDSAIQ